MLKTLKATTIASLILSTALTQVAHAGGLADAIVEEEPVVIAEPPEPGLPGWVIPVVALVLIGAVAASSSSDSDEDPEPEPEPEPEVIDDGGFLDPK